MTKISDLVAASVVDPADIRFGVDQTDLSETRQLSLDALQKAGQLRVVDSITQLLLVTNPRDGQLFQTKGYTTPGDGGGNLYRYDLASAATVDGGWVINGPSSVGRYLALDRSVVNVKQFGAFGNGVVDDTTVIQAALGVIPASGGTLYFPAGQYLGELTVTSRSNVRIVGQGLASKLLGGGPGTNCIDIVTSSDITVDTLWCYASGDSAAGDPHVDSGIHVNACSDVAVRNVHCTNHGYAGIYFHNSTSGVIENCELYDAAGFTSTNSSDIVIAGDIVIRDYRIIGNECVSTNNHGILIQPTVSDLDHKNFVIEGNICRDHGRYGILVYLNIAVNGDDTIKAATTTGNVCENNGWGGIYYQSVDTSTISGNVTRGNGIGGAGSGIEGGIHVNGCVGVAITGNTCFDEIGVGINLNGHAAYSIRRKGITVTGNTVLNQTTTGHASIKVGQTMSDCSIVGNYVYGSASQGIQVLGSMGVPKTVSIIGNTLDGLSSLSRGIEVFGPDTSAIIVGNRVTGFQTGIRVDGVNVVHLKENRATGNTFDYVSNATIGDLRLGENTFGTISDPATYTATTITGANPSVLGRRVVQTANAGATTMTGLSNGIERQEVIVLFNDANTTVDFTGTTLKGNGGVDWTPTTGDHMVCTKMGGNWYCITSDNTA